MNIRKVKYKDIERIPKLKINKSFKQHFSGSSPAPFIGRIGYPYINVGVLSPQISGNTNHYDSPKQWSSTNANIGEIASLRYGLVNSRMKMQVKGISKFRSITQEVGMARKAVEMEIKLTKPPSLNLNNDSLIKPFGPSSTIQKARVTENVTVDTRVERVVDDTDLKANKAILSLYKKGFEESSLNKLMSVGNVGIGKNRKLVPTRWSITAVDDTVGKDLIDEVKKLPIGDFYIHFGGGWGNYYLLLYFPEVWSYELFETYLQSPVNPWSKQGHMYSTDYESFKGRKTYADETAGGYYACRLPVLEKMRNNKRQGSCLALRFITSEYNVPLGVWVCREATRKSIESNPILFQSQEEMISYAIEFIYQRFNFDLNLLLKESKLLQEKKHQKKLSEFVYKSS